MGSSSAARDLRFNQTTPNAALKLAKNAEPKMAKIIPFRPRQPLEEPRASINLNAVIRMHEAQNTANHPSEHTPQHRKEYKDKGQFSKAGAALNEHWLIAWVVWYCYVEIMSRGGLRISDGTRRIEEVFKRTHAGTR